MKSYECFRKFFCFYLDPNLTQKPTIFTSKSEIFVTSAKLERETPSRIIQSSSDIGRIDWHGSELLCKHRDTTPQK